MSADRLPKPSRTASRVACRIQSGSALNSTRPDSKDSFFRPAIFGLSFVALTIETFPPLGMSVARTLHLFYPFMRRVATGKVPNYFRIFRFTYTYPTRILPLLTTRRETGRQARGSPGREYREGTAGQPSQP